MRVSGIMAVIAIVALPACVSAGSHVESADAPAVIYSPPVKPGGRGSILFLDSGQTGAADNADGSQTSTLSPEGAVLSTLHLFLTGNDSSVCLNPVMAHASIADTDWADVREEMRENGMRSPSARQMTAHMIADDNQYGWEGWAASRDAKELSPEVAREIAAAHVQMARRTPKQRTGMRLQQQEVSADITLEEGCIAGLAAPAIRNDWAFVGVNLSSTGFLYALHRIEGRWQVLAYRLTWLH